MRIYLKTTPNTELVPFNYQVALVGALHKWLGEDNSMHDDLSLYSLSWLFGGKGTRQGLNFSNGATFFISSPNVSFLKNILKGVQEEPDIRFGMQVREAVLSEPPDFQEYQRFFLQSPVLIKRLVSDGIKFFFPKDKEADQLLTETMKNKLGKAGFDNLEIQIQFDKTYQNPRTKLVNYKGIKNKATFCPVILEGHPEAIAFAWEVGIGNSTGIGFGALK